jgi:hypothetical protein
MYQSKTELMYGPAGSLSENWTCYIHIVNEYNNSTSQLHTLHVLGHFGIVGLEVQFFGAFHVIHKGMLLIS